MFNYKNHKIKVYNSITGKKEQFKPINDGYVGMYVCGPTVYSKIHLGNIRTFLSFDIVFRYLRSLGYKVRYVRNITDVGHLLGDLDSGEDKITKMAIIEQLEPMEVVQKYTVDFHNIMERFNILPPSIEPNATGHILEQIDLINELIDLQLAYESNGSVYFNVKKYSELYNYGILSRRNLINAKTNYRELEGQNDKKNVADFALWKHADRNHLMNWSSPWGLGFPGWHTECAAMSKKYLGNKFDIHGGGIDLKFPHHESEIAQRTACTGEIPANYWLHTNLLTLNGKKMSKSTNNNLLLEDITTIKHNVFNINYSAHVIRFLMLQTHYRSVMDFSETALLSAEKGYNRLMKGLEILPRLKAKLKSTIDIQVWKKKCFKSMNDDFNTPLLISYLFDGISMINKFNDNLETLSERDLTDFKNCITKFTEDILGLPIITLENKDVNLEKLYGVINLLIEIRDDARENKNFILADHIRNQLQLQGIKVNDFEKHSTFELII